MPASISGELHSDHDGQSPAVDRSDIDYATLRPSSKSSRPMVTGAWTAEKPRMRPSAQNLDGLMTPTSHRSRSSRSSILTGDGHDFSFKRKHRVSASEHSISSQRYSLSPLGGHRDSAFGSAHGRRSSQTPLVLLHVSLLPSSGMTCSIDVLEEINAPNWVIENQRLLLKRMDLNTRERGMLITHPGEEFDLLEERILESLNLCPPRLLACGHFNSDVVEDHPNAHESGPSPDAIETDHGSPFDTCCEECKQPMREVDRGVGVGSRRYDIQVFAANGLLRSGSWSAAYREMEKVDIEINVWMPEQVRKDLELWHQQQAAKHHLQVLKMEENEQKSRERDEMLEMALNELRRIEVLKLELEEARKRAEDEVYRLKNQLQQVQNSTNRHAPNYAIEAPQITQDEQSKRFGAVDDIPITTLLRNCCHIVFTDRRNLAVILLSIAVAVLALGAVGGGPRLDTSDRQMALGGIADATTFAKDSFASLTSNVASPMTTATEHMFGASEASSASAASLSVVTPMSFASGSQAVPASAVQSTEASPQSPSTELPLSEAGPLLNEANAQDNSSVASMLSS